MATPHVAAAAALLAARNPTLTTIQLKQAILDEAESVAAGPRLNAAAALGAVPADADGDLDLDAADNCPSVYNPSQKDTDRDSTGDACEDGQPRWTGTRTMCPTPRMRVRTSYGSPATAAPLPQ